MFVCGGLEGGVLEGRRSAHVILVHTLRNQEWACLESELLVALQPLDNILGINNDSRLLWRGFERVDAADQPALAIQQDDPHFVIAQPLDKVRASSQSHRGRSLALVQVL